MMARAVGVFVTLIFAACAGGGSQALPAATGVNEPRLARAPAPRTGPATCLATLSVTDAAAPLPGRLGETNCFTDLAALAPANHVAWYDVRSPLYSDGAGKERYLSLPAGSAVTEAAGKLVLPAGAAMIKVFGLAETLEVRFLFRGAGFWRVFTYRWMGAENDGRLVTSREYADVGGLRYVFPEEGDCRSCHREENGHFALALRDEQLNGEWRYPAGPANQMAVLAEAGYLAAPGERAAGWPDPADPAEPLEARARSYLAANCAHCHHPNGNASALIDLDLRYERSLAETHLCDPTFAFAPRGSRRVVAGRPEDSWLVDRLTRTDANRMSPWRSVPDPLGVALVTEWIASLETCP